jgi:hypothetical protein
MNKTPLAALVASVIVAVAKFFGYVDVPDEAAYSLAVALLALALFLGKKFGWAKSSANS